MRNIFITLTLLMACTASAQTDSLSMSDILDKLKSLEKMKAGNDTVSSLKIITDVAYAKSLEKPKMVPASTLNVGDTMVAVDISIIEPLIVFDTMSYEIGSITQGDVITRKFNFKNVGKSKLYVTQIVVDCGCTEPEWTQDAIMPGESGYIIAKYDSKDDIGKFQKSLTVVHNSGDGFSYITLSGFVAPKL